MEDLPPQGDIGGLLAALRSRGVRFMVVGGMAGLAHGSSYPTFDLDIAYDRDPRNLERLAAALRDLDARLRGAPPDLPFLIDAETLAKGLNFTFETRLGPLDLLGEIRGVGPYSRVAKSAVEARIDGVDVDVISLDHLIAMKAAAGRDKDKLMVAEYLAIADERRKLADDASGG